MSKLINGFKNFVREEDAPTAVEYGLMVALVAAAIIIAATALGTQTSTVFQNVANAIGGVAG